MKDIRNKIYTLLEDGEKKNLYICRPLKNADEFIAWAKEQGFKSTLKADDLHVTQAYSTAKVDWSTIPDSFDYIQSSLKDGKRSVEPLGDGGAIVLKFKNADLDRRWKELCDLGCSWDYESYQAHVTITYEGGDVDLDDVTPFEGVLEFGPEKYEELDTDKEIEEE